MGSYYDPDAIEREGVARKTEFALPASGCAHIAVMDNGGARIAVDVSLLCEYEKMVKTMRGGFWAMMEVYEVPTERLRLCRDESRRPSKRPQLIRQHRLVQ